MSQNDPARNQDHDMHRGAQKTEPRDATDAGRKTRPKSPADTADKHQDDGRATGPKPAGGNSGR